MSLEKGFLPKNFRQIGEKEDRVKIYLEDYVQVYLERTRQSAGEVQAGVLLGVHELREEVPCLFICGAVGTERLSFRDGRLFFLEEAWEDISAQMREYFPDLGICGWYVHEKCGMSVDRLSLKKTYQKLFAQGDKVLLLSEEGNEDFYILRDGRMLKMLGHYIYYEKNDAMQAYMARGRRGVPVDSEPRPDAAVAFRKKMEEKQEERRQSVAAPEPAKDSFLETAFFSAAVLALAWILGMGSGAWHERLSEAREAAATLQAGEYVSLTAPGEETEADDESVAWEDAASGEASASGERASDAGAGDQTLDDTQGEGQESVDSGAREEAAEAAGAVVSYQVRPGETLAGICRSRYGSTERLEEICALNQISDPDHIEVGQEILLPE
ncbi:MAG: LysM peptidoglycan-binding domain-containing protein [Lachnospiraceae bacterium]|nr:LysM peptidoglycan-binding domain-containing protein [Lachnospiraceae bacterium]